MGQQQLILLVLATVIVGIAIVVGIRAFNENSIKANSDAMIQDMIRIANDAQAWKQKPAPFGGQAAGTAKENPADFTGADFTGLGYDDSAIAGVYSNLNGAYALTESNASLIIFACSGQKDNSATITVTGLTDLTIASSAISLGTNSNCDGTAATNVKNQATASS